MSAIEDVGKRRSCLVKMLDGEDLVHVSEFEMENEPECGLMQVAGCLILERFGVCRQRALREALDDGRWSKRTLTRLEYLWL